jgi:hypothetical protein
MLTQRSVSDDIQHRFQMSSQRLPSQQPPVGQAVQAGAPVAAVRCVLGIYGARYALALRRATAASSSVERQAAFAEAQRIIEVSLPLRRQIAAPANASAVANVAPACASPTSPCAG